MTWLGRNICYSPEAGAGAGAGDGIQGGQGGAGQGGAGAGAGAAKPWYDGKLDAESLGHIELKGWKKDDVADVAINAVKAHRELQKHFGVPETQLLKLPKDTADEAGWKGVFNRLGVPKEAKEYDLSSVKFNGVDLEAAFADKMREAMFSANVLKDKAPTVVKAMVDYLEAADKAEAAESAARLKTEREALAANWKHNFEFNRLTAIEGARRVGVTKETLAKLEGELGGASVMEMFRKFGAGTSEDPFHDGGQNGAPTTQNGAKAQLAQLMADPAWGKRLTAGDAATKREFDNLMLTIHGQAA